MDVLSEIFSVLRLEAGLYFSTCLRGDFAVRLAAEHRHIRFHLALEGECVVTVPGQQQARLVEGDLVLIPDGASQILSSGIDVCSAIDLGDVLSRAPPADGVLTFGEEGALCRLLCGFVRFDEALDHPVLNNLPPVIVLPRHGGRADGEGAAGVTAALALLRAEAEAAQGGQTSIIHRVVEILLMQTVRSSLVEQGPNAASFPGALADPRLSRALTAIHSEAERGWNVDTLARAAGMSRTRFAQRFTEAIGLAPIAYLTQWRMIKARQLLGQPGLDMAEIAERCGYQSVPAFGRRFAATFGTGPGEWRRQNLASMRGASTHAQSH